MFPFLYHFFFISFLESLIIQECIYWAAYICEFFSFPPIKGFQFHVIVIRKNYCCDYSLHKIVKTYFNVTDSSLQSINLICCGKKKKILQDRILMLGQQSPSGFSPIHSNINLFIWEADSLWPCWTLGLKSCVRQGSFKRVRKTMDSKAESHWKCPGLKFLQNSCCGAGDLNLGYDVCEIVVFTSLQFNFALQTEAEAR